MNNVIVEKTDPGIVILRVSRPKALNALNSATLIELKDTLTALSRDPSVRVVLLAGDGEKAFIAGADISEMQKMSSHEAVQFSQLGHDVALLLELMPKPTIAVVQGFALGGGTEMALACDFIVASEKAVFGQPEVGLGVIPGFGGTIRLAKYIGYPRAKELIFSGRKIKADEALAWGLINHVFSTEDLMPKALEIAKTIALQSSTAVNQAKRLLNEFSESVGLHRKSDAEAQAFGQLAGTHDQQEGMAAFIEKRKPLFDGL
ncbi:MAG: hypothetical protein A2428_04785 [Bdellovibrionales bacterium RIFOXYC1_FULL_54_43]|nr:MAG: hypothetical protein A2428_04785 [Bdellovibrionales bacterium RIFOXYC1_FULL_54_43]OFZ83907.1 MAG: hypothetical protein A2603_09155 [Bdellovibrionales bacterium RIFOXYD1_FULL_55_31]